MVPSDEQRAPLMIEQMERSRAQLREASARPSDQAVDHPPQRRAGYGHPRGAQLARINEKTLAENPDSPNGPRCTIEAVRRRLPEPGAIVERPARVRAGHRRDGGSGRGDHADDEPARGKVARHRPPYYVLIDSLKVPELIAATTSSDDLRKRVRGTGHRADRALGARATTHSGWTTRRVGRAARRRSQAWGLRTTRPTRSRTRWRPRETCPSAARVSPPDEAPQRGGHAVDVSSTKIWQRFSS